MTLDRERFDRTRAAAARARDAMLTYRATLEAKYGGQLWRETVTETRKVERLDRAYERESDRFFALLDDGSPRDWRSGVPAHWVLLELPYEDAVRPLTEPLGKTPPRGFGVTRDMR